MYKVLAFALLIVLASCSSKEDLKKEIDQLNSKVESMEKSLEKSYTPGLGMLMNAVQAHHLKLWKAGANSNWELAGFEIHELEERFEDIEKFHSEHEETKQLSIIYPSIESIEKAVSNQNRQEFVVSYENLTATCNSCHQVNDHPFIKIKTPFDGSGNQDFTK